METKKKHWNSWQKTEDLEAVTKRDTDDEGTTGLDVKETEIMEPGAEDNGRMGLQRGEG